MAVDCFSKENTIYFVQSWSFEEGSKHVERGKWGIFPRPKEASDVKKCWEKLGELIGCLYCCQKWLTKCKGGGERERCKQASKSLVKPRECGHVHRSADGKSWYITDYS